MNPATASVLPDPSPSALRAVVDLFVNPLPALVRAVRIPRSGWIPYLVLALGGLVVAAIYLHVVDISWLIDRILARMPRAARHRAAHELTASVFAVTTLVGSFLSLSVGLIISAAYYYVFLSMGGRQTSFFSMLSLSAWTSLPGVLVLCSSLVVILVSGAHTGPSVLDPTTLAFLLHLKPGAHYYDAASTFSLIDLWVWFLAILAFRKIYGYRLSRAVAIVLVPYLIYYALLLWL